MTNVFSRSRELAELKNATALLEIGERNATAKLEQVNAKIDRLTADTEACNSRIQARTLEKSETAFSLEQSRMAIKALTDKQTQLEAEDGELIDKIIATNKQIRAYEHELEQLNEELARQRSELDTFQSDMFSGRDVKEMKMKELTDLRVEIGGLTQSIKSSRDSVARLESEIKKAEAECIEYEAEITKNAAAITDCEKHIEDLSEALAQLETDTETQKERIAALEHRISSINERISEAENAEREHINIISSLKNEEARLTMRKEQIDADSRRLYDEMWDEYNITYREALTYTRLDMPQNQMTREERQIKSDIQALGNINVGAVEEFKTVKKRHEFLTQQRDDITAAEEKLTQLIVELTTQMEAQFSEQLELISENFALVFREMFGGGKAYLKLTDADNVLESGIDIIAQPPGKTLQSMSLLSGGERALTATALLFGILRLKPSPFCVLDEVEAALDDANVTKYANYIKGISRETQFIIITHRKGTMECADVLYGVTMQELGVSKLLSIKLEGDVYYNDGKHNTA